MAFRYSIEKEHRIEYCTYPPTFIKDIIKLDDENFYGCIIFNPTNENEIIHADITISNGAHFFYIQQDDVLRIDGENLAKKHKNLIKFPESDNYLETCKNLFKNMLKNQYYFDNPKTSISWEQYLCIK